MKLKFVETHTTRHGKTAFYYRRAKGVPRIRLPDPTSAEFAEAYQRASEFIEPIRPRTSSEMMEDRRRLATERSICNTLSRAKSRAAAKGWDYDLSRTWARKELDVNGYRCPITSIGFDPHYAANGRLRPFSPSIDRIDNSKGYTQDNCRIVVTAINLMLNDWGIEVVREVFRAIRYTDRSKAGTSNPSPQFQVRGGARKPLKGKGFPKQWCP